MLTSKNNNNYNIGSINISACDIPTRHADVAKCWKAEHTCSSFVTYEKWEWAHEATSSCLRRSLECRTWPICRPGWNSSCGHGSRSRADLTRSSRRLWRLAFSTPSRMMIDVCCYVYIYIVIHIFGIMLASFDFWCSFWAGGGGGGVVIPTCKMGFPYALQWRIIIDPTQICPKLQPSQNLPLFA